MKNENHAINVYDIFDENEKKTKEKKKIKKYNLRSNILT